MLRPTQRLIRTLRHPRWPIRGVRGLQRLWQVDDRSSATALLRSDGGSGVCGVVEVAARLLECEKAWRVSWRRYRMARRCVITPVVVFVVTTWFDLIR